MLVPAATEVIAPAAVNCHTPPLVQVKRPPESPRSGTVLAPGVISDAESAKSHSPTEEFGTITSSTRPVVQDGIALIVVEPLQVSCSTVAELEGVNVTEPAESVCA